MTLEKPEGTKPAMLEIPPQMMLDMILGTERTHEYCKKVHELIKENPNDIDLGAKVRALVW